jgi:hypothetical protein
VSAVTHSLGDTLGRVTGITVRCQSRSQWVSHVSRQSPGSSLQAPMSRTSRVRTRIKVQTPQSAVLWSHVRLSVSLCLTLWCARGPRLSRAPHSIANPTKEYDLYPNPPSVTSISERSASVLVSFSAHTSSHARSCIPVPAAHRNIQALRYSSNSPSFFVVEALYDCGCCSMSQQSNTAASVPPDTSWAARNFASSSNRRNPSISQPLPTRLSPACHPLAETSSTRTAFGTAQHMPD